MPKFSDYKNNIINPKVNNIRRNWFKFSRNQLSVYGLIIVCLVLFIAIFAPIISPYPESAGKYINFLEASKPPSTSHLFGTDIFGRDVLTRIFFGYRLSLIMAAVVLSIVVPTGVVLGLIAGYFRDTWIDTVIMRITDIFVAVPPLVLALAVCSVLTPGVFNAMLAVSVSWWPWYTRIVYGITSSLKNEYYVQAVEVIGAKSVNIIFREILPNCISLILTKMSLDIAWVILIGSSLSFVGLGAQQPTPDLGSMVAEGSRYLPDQWWIAIFPGFAIMIVVLGFNLLGDGLRDMFGSEGV